MTTRNSHARRFAGRPSGHAVCACLGQYDAGLDWNGGDGLTLQYVPDRAEPARARGQRRVPRMGSPTSLPDRVQWREQADLDARTRPPRARHRDHGRLAGDYLLSLAARTSRSMAVAIGGIEVRLALNGFASRVAS
jgi:hypothetical protein